MKNYTAQLITYYAIEVKNDKTVFELSNKPKKCGNKEQGVCAEKLGGGWLSWISGTSFSSAAGPCNVGRIEITGECPGGLRMLPGS